MKTLSTTLLALASATLLALANAPATAQVPAKPAAAAKPATSAAAASLLLAQSELAFVSKQMGVPVEGKFKRFDAQLSFDPKKPEAAKVSFTIELASATLGAPEFDAELVKASWFDTKRVPQATFQSTAVKALGGGRYEVAGKLSIKGQVRDVSVPIALTQAGGTTTAAGGFVLKRLEFKIGDGEWADTSMVANDVQVKFKLAFNGIAPL